MSADRQPRFQPVSPERHAAHGWRPSNSYAWAAREAVVPLVGSELPRAVLAMPVAFIRQHEMFLPVALLGFEPGAGLFVAADGRWTGGYVPAALRARPFVLVALEDGRKILCVDEEAGHVAPRQQAPDAQPFFAEDGKLASRVQEVMRFLSAVEENRELTRKACAALETHKVLVPWEITLQMEAGPRKVEGLYRIDEAALGQLPDAAFLELRRAGALAVAYAQLISMAQLPALGQRASARLAALKPVAAPVTAAGDLDLSFLERGGTLRFS